MEKQEIQEEGINVVDIFKLLLSRIKLLIIVVLVVGLAGGAFAIFRTHNIDYYGTTAQFYVNPRKTDDVTSESEYGVYGTYSVSVMDGIVKLLNSESFTEQLLLNGSPLPAKDVWATAEEEEKIGLNGLIDAATVDVEEVAKRQNELIAKKELKSTTSKTMADAYDALNKAWGVEYRSDPDTFTSATFNERLYLTLSASGEYKDLDFAYDTYQSAKDAYEVAEKDEQNAQAALKEPRNKMTVSVDKALKAWRKTEKYKEELKRYKDPIKFSYLGEGESIDDVQNKARSFIYVKINVLQDKDFAEELFDVIKTVVPTYVENNMPQINGFNETNCQRITRNDDIRLTNPGYTTKQAIIYGLLGGILAFAVTSIVLVILDKSDKRLRDVEAITKNFNLPVLGVIPNLEDIEEINKKEEKATEKSDVAEVK